VLCGRAERCTGIDASLFKRHTGWINFPCRKLHCLAQPAFWHTNCAQSLLRINVDLPRLRARFGNPTYSVVPCTRYVRAEVLPPEYAVALFFFRHDDQVWHVFQPEAQRITIGGYANAGRREYRTGLIAATLSNKLSGVTMSDKSR